MPRRRSPQRATGADAQARMQLDRLRRALDAEIERRRIDVDLEPAGVAPVDIDDLSAVVADLPTLVHRVASGLRRGAGSRRTDLLGLTAATRRFFSEQRSLARRRASGEALVDSTGFDREWTESLLPAFRWMYRTWWHTRVLGIDNVPASGRGLLVANHAGVLPYDGAMIRVALWEEHPHPRHARALVLSTLMDTPVLSWLLRRTGNTIADTRDAEYLLREGELVLVFPEGVKGSGKPWNERYRLRRFGRGGFVEVALRTASPIIPVSVVGSEEVHPMLADLAPVARAMRLPYFPITPTFPWLGPLGALPLPSSWIIEFHPPVIPGDLGLGPDDADDPRAVLRLSDRVRDVIQTGIYRNLEERGSVFAVS